MKNLYRVLMSSGDRVGLEYSDRICDKTVAVRCSSPGEVRAHMVAIRHADEELTPEQRAQVRSIECWYVGPVLPTHSRRAPNAQTDADRSRRLIPKSAT